MGNKREIMQFYLSAKLCIYSEYYALWCPSYLSENLQKILVSFTLSHLSFFSLNLCCGKKRGELGSHTDFKYLLKQQKSLFFSPQSFSHIIEIIENDYQRETLSLAFDSLLQQFSWTPKWGILSLLSSVHYILTNLI